MVADKDVDKVALLDRGIIPICEPWLDAPVARGVAAGRLRFETDVPKAVASAELISIAVGTPTRRGDDYAHLGHVLAAARDIATDLRRDVVVVTTFNVPLGTGAPRQSLVARIRPDLSVAVASNPEFLRERSAIEHFLRPDRVVCDVNNHVLSEAFHTAYGPRKFNDLGVLPTNIETAELMKCAVNSCMAMEIMFINDIADLCEAVDADVQIAAHGTGHECRIGPPVPQRRPRLWRLPLPRGQAPAVANRQYGRCAATARRDGRQRRRTAQANDEPQGPTRGRWQRRRRDDPRPRHHLQAQHRRHARESELRDRAGAVLAGVTWGEGACAAVQDRDLMLSPTEWTRFRALARIDARGCHRGSA